MNSRPGKLPLVLAVWCCLWPAGALAQADSTGADEADTTVWEGSGEGEIVLIHGLGSSASIWDEVTPFLQRVFKVWLYELPGHGTTPPVPNPTIDSVTGLLGEFLAENRIVYPTLVGHSLGGLIAMRYTFDHPADVNRLIVIDVAPKQFASAEQKLYVSDQLVHNYDRFVASQFLNMSARQDITDRVIDQALRTDSASFVSLLLSSFDFDLSEELPRQTVPILVIGSNFLFPEPARSRARLDELGFDTARTISFKHVPGTGHFVMLERPAYVASVILFFIISQQSR